MEIKQIRIELKKGEPSFLTEIKKYIRLLKPGVNSEKLTNQRKKVKNIRSERRKLKRQIRSNGDKNQAGGFPGGENLF